MNFNVFVFPKYDMNLYEFHKKYYERFNDDIISTIFKECTKSLVTLAGKNFTHNDIKPRNFLINFKPDDLSKLEIVLTDFGMFGQNVKGGTPVFASPECFSETTPSSDMYSLGRVFLFILLPRRQFSKFLFVPICDDDS